MRPSTCRIATEDGECLGCGDKLIWMGNTCGYEEDQKRKAVEVEAKERAELARLKAKYEGKP